MNPVLSLLRRSPFAVVVLIFLSANPSEAQMITAHRGASYDAPENTLAAFQLAWQQQADAIEADFYLSADKQIVCIHDKDTLRTAGVKLIVEETPFAELRALGAGAWKHSSFAAEKIPTFEEVLATVPKGKRFVIELKSDERIVPVLASELKRLAPPRESLLIISFNEKSIALCKQLMPDIRAHWLTDLKGGKANKKPLTADAVANVVRRTGADGVGMKGDLNLINRSFIDKLLAQGCPEFHVWTIDDVAEAKYFQSLGAVGITTNRPALIRESIGSQ
ncbi:MAG: glycerophosphodiester phosphodiesterase [Planctomycetaceae bacterium]